MLNNKEKFKINISTFDFQNNIKNYFIFLDLEESFGTENMNFDKQYENYNLSVKLKINDKSQKEIYDNLKDTLLKLLNLTKKYDEIEEKLNYPSKNFEFTSYISYLNQIFKLEDQAKQKESIYLIEKKLVDFSFTEMHNYLNFSQDELANDEFPKSPLKKSHKKRLDNENRNLNIKLLSDIEKKIITKDKTNDKDPLLKSILEGNLKATNDVCLENIRKEEEIINIPNVNIEKKDGKLPDDKPNLNFKMKMKLVDETNQKYKAENNPFTGKYVTKNKTKVVSKNSESLLVENKNKNEVENKVKAIVENTNFKNFNNVNKCEGSLLALLNIGIRGEGILFSSDFDISSTYGAFLLEQSRI